MPHVVFNKQIDLEEFCRKFQTLFQKEPQIIRMQEVFLNKEKNTLLIPTLVIDEFHQEFMIEIITKEDRTTLRLYPQTDPQKTVGVKIAMGLIVQIILRMMKDIYITKTNIYQYVPKKLTSDLS
ncbi:MAG TPA: hypothetical protein VLD38_07485 [Nitrosopumilaceae archaeon]|nr:hypothetical protein [Nitrosopumilaceae archaeon]